jgi:hypothetical protein
MLELFTTDEFAAWFAALEDDAAEDVATAMETVQELGPSRPAPDSSEWLLWYEHRDAPEFVLADDWTSFQESTKELVSRLESPAFAKKLRALPREEAGKVMLAVERLKMASAWRRRGLAMLVAACGGGGDADAMLRQVYRTVASATGLVAGDVAVHSSALRELTVRSRASRFRVLYGVDLRRDVALAVAGERLDRSFYGDSVRRAQRVWQQFLQGNVETRERAPR